MCSRSFPYFTQGQKLTVTGLELYAQDVSRHQAVGDATTATADLADPNRLAYALASAPNTVLTRTAEADVFLVIRYDMES